VSLDDTMTVCHVEPSDHCPFPLQGQRARAEVLALRVSLDDIITACDWSLPLTIGWAGVCCERGRSAHDVNGTFKEGPDTRGGGLVPRRTHRRGGHTGTSRPTGDTKRDRGATALTRASRGMRMTSLGHHLNTSLFHCRASVPGPKYVRSTFGISISYLITQAVYLGLTLIGARFGRWREEIFGRARCLTLRYSLLLSVWVDPSAEHTCDVEPSDHCPLPLQDQRARAEVLALYALLSEPTLRTASTPEAGASNRYIYIYIYIYICMYVCRVYIYIYMYIYIYIYVYVCVCVCVLYALLSEPTLRTASTPEAGASNRYIYMYVCMYACIYIYIYIYICVYMCVCVCVLFALLSEPTLRTVSTPEAGASNRYIYIYVCMYVCMYIYMYMYIYVCVCVYSLRVTLRANATHCFFPRGRHKQVYIYIHIYVCMYVYIKRCIERYMYVFMYIYMYLYIHIHIYIYIYIHIYICLYVYIYVYIYI